MQLFGLKDQNHRLTKYKPAEAIDIIVKAIAPMLKAEGYKKLGRTWSKDMGDFVFIVCVRANPWNGSDTGASFDVEYTIFVPRVFKVLNTGKQPKHPKSYNCVFGQNISGSHQRVRWEIFDDTNIDTLKENVSVQIKQQCLDAFAKISTLEDVKSQLIDGLFVAQSHHVLGLAILCAEMGDMLHAKQYFGKVINDQRRPQTYRDRGVTIARQYGMNGEVGW